MVTMSSPATTTQTSTNIAAERVAAGASTGVIVFLGALHVLSPEFAPSWRAVSEYANGRYSWVLSLMFISWAVSSVALAIALAPVATTKMLKAGRALLFVAAVGEGMAAFFDINHPLHGVAAFFGVLGFPVAAMLLGYGLTRSPEWSGARSLVRTLSNLTWLSVVLLGVSLGLFISALKSAGIEMSPNAKPLTELPAGVSAFVGWANRLLILVYCVWVIVVARALRRVDASAARAEPQRTYRS